MPETDLTAANITVKFGNAPEAPETIYRASDPTVNKLTLAVTVSVDAGLTKAKPVPKAEAAKASGTLLYLDLRNLQLSDAELKALKVSAEGWASLLDPAGYVCLAPEEDSTQKAEAPIEARIEGLAMSQPPEGETVGLYLYLFRVGGVTTKNVGLPWSFKSLLAEPPSGKANLHEALALEVPQRDVVIAEGKYAGYQNSLLLQLSPGDKRRTIKAGPDTVFELSFVYAPEDDPEGYGALCTAPQARNINLKGGQNTQGWHITPPGDEQNPTWTLKPTDGMSIGNVVVSFLIREVETQLRPGPTLMFLTYSGVPGYEDGAFTRVLEKVGHATIESFTIKPNPVKLQGGSAMVNLAWKTRNASVVSINDIGVVEPAEEGEKEVEILETTLFTLEAEGPPDGRNSALQTEKAVVLPVINSFEANPDAVHQKDFPRAVDLSWNVATKEEVGFVSSTVGKYPLEFEPVGSRDFPMESPQMITLVPKGGVENPLVQRSVVVSAFEPQLAQQQLTAAPSCVAASPSGAFVVIGSSTRSGVVALDTMTYQPIGDPVSTGSEVSDLAFSPDGSVLYAACAGKAVSAISVKATGRIPQYEFTDLGDLALAGEPRRIAVAPSGKYVYVSTADKRLVVLEAGSNGTLTELASLPTGAEPEGVAVLPTGSRVYVANAGDKSVTVVGVSESGHHKVVKTIGGLLAEPIGIAVSEDGKVLLIACRGGEVFVRSVEFPEALGNTLTAGVGSCDIALVPGGRYAAVANKDVNTVTLLGLGKNPGACKVVEAGVAAGPGPVAVSVTPEAGLVLVATSGAKSLSVLTLAEYQETEQPVEAGGQVTDVVVAPDSSKAVVWHDARVKVGRGEPSKGVFAYELASQQVTPQLTNQPIVDFVFHPTNPNRAFAVALDYPYVEVVDTSTSTWQPAGSFDLSPLTEGAPRGLAVAADGLTLFVLAGNSSNQFDLVALAIGKEGALSAIGKAVRVFASTRGTIAAVAAAPDGSCAYVLDEADEKLWIVARKEGQYALEAGSVALEEHSTALALSPDGSQLFVLSRPGNSNNLTAIATAGLHASTLVLSSIDYSSLNGLVVSPDNSKVFVTDATMAGIRVLDAKSLRLIQTISFENEVLSPMGVAVTPTGSQLFTANVRSNNLGVARQVQPTGEGGRGTKGGE